MKRIHPNVSYTAALAMIAIGVASGGCRNTSSGISNPFLAPDRVPPPATRALAPGQAQPYYPGDPLPVMQSKTAQPASPAVATAEGQPMPSADTNLAWGSPNRSAQPNSAAPVAAAPANTAPDSRVVAASAEPAVAIPADGDAMRFELQPPPTEPELFTPVVAVPMPSQQPIQFAAAPPTSGVVPASYNAPNLAPTEPTPSPWRSPEFNAANDASMIPPPPTAMQPTFQPNAAAPIYLPTSPAPPMVANNVDVQLRAVPSPPPESMWPTTPRIRLPGSLPSPPSVSSNDGFRPRSSMR